MRFCELLTLIVLFAFVGAGVATAGPAIHEKSQVVENQANVAKVYAGQVDNVGSSWQTVSLPFSYEEMVVVATPMYTSAEFPAVVRIRNAEDASFEIRVQSPSGRFLSGYAVQFLVVEAGVYTEAEHGITLEAGKVVSSQTNYSGFWSGQEVGFQQAYAQPVVLGQVMSFNDERWSAFWSHGIIPSFPAGFGSLFVGKHVGEDLNRVRIDETLGYVVLETGTSRLDGYQLHAFVGADAVEGMGNVPPYVYEHDFEGNGFVVATQAAMDGSNGSWAVLWGSDALQDGQVQLVVDEDMLGDEERVHSAEQVSVVVLEITQPAPEILSFSPQTGISGEDVDIFGNHFIEVIEVTFNGLPAAFTVDSDQQIEAFAPEGVTTGPITVRTAGGTAITETDFVVVKTPQIFSFSPEEGERGETVEITGQNFIDIKDVSFGGWSSKSVQVVSDTRIIATVPQNSKTGRIRVRNEAGMATTPDVFRVLAITAFDDIVPSRAPVMATIKIKGDGFLEASEVQFAGGIVADFTVLSDEEMEVTVPQESISGPVNIVFGDGSVLEGPVEFVLAFTHPFQGINMCRLATATMAQSSVAAPFAQAGKACDGITEGRFTDGSFTNTQSENGAWWQVDLGGVFNISEVAIWNRADCCQDDMSNFYVFISDTPFPSFNVSDVLQQPAVTSFLVDEIAAFESFDANRSGRYIRVQKNGTGPLVLAEVEVISGDGNVTTNTENPDATSAVQLHDAYPSPFQNTTTLTYQLDQPQHINLVVFDVLGREVQVLVDETKTAGSHQTTFDAGSLPNGMYFYRLTSGNEVITKKVVLSR